MLPKLNRLPGNALRLVKAEGKIFQGKYVAVCVLPNGLEINRFGAVVSKKVALNAVTRNLNKRLIYSNVQNNFDKLVPGYDVVFLAKRRMIVTNTDIIKEDILHTLKASGVLKD